VETSSNWKDSALERRLARRGNAVRTVLSSVVALTCAACGGGTGEEVTQASEAVEEYTTFDVEWNPDARHVEVETVVERLVTSDLDNGQLVFESGITQIENLEIGSAAVIGGVGVFRILDRLDTADGTELSVEPVPLTAVIDDGVIAWHRVFPAPDPSRQTVTIGQQSELDSIAQVRQALEADYDSLSFSGQLGSFDTNFSMTSSEDGFSVETSAKWEEDPGLIKFYAAGTLSGFSNETQLEIVGNELTNMTIMVHDLSGSFNIQAGSVASGSTDVTLKVPGEVSLTMLLGGIPFRVGLGGSIEIGSTLQASSTALIKGDAKFSGSVGVTIEGTNVNRIGDFKATKLDWTDGQQVTTVTAGYSGVLTFPELSVGVGIKKLAGAEAFMRVRSEAVTNMTIQYGSAGLAAVPESHCLEAQLNVGASYGGRAELLGVTLAEEEYPLFSDFGKAVYDGEGCDQE